MKTPAQYQKNNREEGAETGCVKEHWDCVERGNTKAEGRVKALVKKTMR